MSNRFYRVPAQRRAALCSRSNQGEAHAVYVAVPATAIVMSVLMSSVQCLRAAAAFSMMCGSFSATAASAIHFVCCRWLTPGVHSGAVRPRSCGLLTAHLHSIAMQGW